ncbi:MAG: hypothetical protein ACT4NV_08945 [Rhodoferax sp.]
MEISPSRASTAPASASPPPREASDRAQRQEQAQDLEAEKRAQSSPPHAYLNAQGQATGRLLDAKA